MTHMMEIQSKDRMATNRAQETKGTFKAAKLQRYPSSVYARYARCLLRSCLVLFFFFNFTQVEKDIKSYHVGEVRQGWSSSMDVH